MHLGGACEIFHKLNYDTDMPKNLEIEPSDARHLPFVLVAPELEKVEASLRELIPPTLLKPIPSQPTETDNPAVNDVAGADIIDLTQTYTGLVVNAKGIDLVPAMAPRILDESGTVVYGNLNLDPVFVKRFGMVGYLRSLEQALENDRVQGNPLVVNALNSSGLKRADLVISDPEAAAIRKLSQSQAFLKEARVVIILD